jgi:tRNA nucleotidyltransferase/poly(A) polymerase
MPTDFLTVLSEFQERNIHYVLVGGLAVLLHGIDRLTADIDLVVDLAPEEASKAVETSRSGNRSAVEGGALTVSRLTCMPWL